jgi:hypothetical protein
MVRLCHSAVSISGIKKGGRESKRVRVRVRVRVRERERKKERERERERESFGSSATKS